MQLSYKVEMVNLKWKKFDEGYIVRFNGKYFYCNQSAKEVLDVLSQSNNIMEAVETVSKKMNITNIEAKEWIEIVNKRPNDIQEYYKDVQNLDSPIKVQWKVTENCNLRCKHCWNGMPEMQSFDDNEYIIMAQKICTWNVLEVTLTGGEIFTINIIEDIIAIFVSKGIFVNLFTNGILIGKHIEFLKAHKNSIQVNISVDGNKEYHEKIRGQNTYYKMLDNVDKLLSNGIKVVSNTVINKMNYLRVSEMIEDLINKGIKNIQISHLILKGNAIQNQKDLLMNNDDYKKFRFILGEYAKKYSSSHTHIYYSDIYNDSNQIQDLNKNNELYFEDWICCAGVTRVTINPNGDVVSCPFFKEYIMGNLLKDDVNKVWISEKRLEFIKLKKKNNNGRHCLAYQFGRL